MCVLVLLRRPLPGWPIVVAANRDEFRARAAEGPQLIEGCAAAGRDLSGGGTWLGVSRDRTVVALTNRRHPPRNDACSRGRVVLDTLLARSTDGRSPGGYNLLIASPRAQIAWEYDGEERLRMLRDDVHVVCSHRDVDDPGAPEDAAVRAQIRACDSIDALREHLRAIQSSHDGDICKHGDAYGTVSSCFVAIHESGLGRSQFWTATGNPCGAAWTDSSGLLRAMDQRR